MKVGNDGSLKIISHLFFLIFELLIVNNPDHQA